MTSTQLVAAILALLDNGNSWCKGTNARDAAGLPCSPMSSFAIEWDIMGALIKAYEGQTNYTAYHEVLQGLTSKIPSDFKSRDLEAYNDDVDWSAIAALLT